MLIKETFQVQERVASGVSYRDMLREFGVFGALIVALLFTYNSMQNTQEMNICSQQFAEQWWLHSVCTPKALERIDGSSYCYHDAIATTEIGTDGWISGIMANAVEFDAGWILVYTSVIMMGLRFLAGPIVHACNLYHYSL